MRFEPAKPSILSLALSLLAPLYIPKDGILADKVATLASEVAIEEGIRLCKALKQEIEAIGQKRGVNYTPLLDLSLSDAWGNKSNTTAGSVFESICVGLSAGIGLGTLYALPERESKALHELIAVKVAEWEVGVGNAGIPPLPFKPDPDMLGEFIHFRYPTGALNGTLSIAHTLMQDCSRVWRPSDPYKNAILCMASALVVIGIAPISYQEHAFMIPRFKALPKTPALHDEEVVLLAHHLHDVDPFWPMLLQRQWIIW